MCSPGNFLDEGEVLNDVMQALIFAAGEGRRMRSLTDTLPKPMVRVGGVPILERILAALPDAIDEIVIVVGYRGGRIVDYFDFAWNGRPIRYVWQEKRAGTAAALQLAKPFLSGKFLVLNADDLHSKTDLAAGLGHSLCVFVAPHDHPECFGVVSLHTDGALADIIEKPDNPPTNLVSTGAMVLDERIFLYTPQLHKTGEYYLPDIVRQLAKEHPVSVSRQGFWIPIGHPEDVTRAEKILEQQATRNYAIGETA